MNSMQELIDALQVMQDFYEKKLFWQEYQAKMKNFSDDVLAQCAGIAARNQQPELFMTR